MATQPPLQPPNPTTQTVVIDAGVIPWQVEQVPLPTPGSPSISYTLLKTPQIGAVIFWNYNGQNIADSQSGFFKFVSNPISFNLPWDTSAGDILQVAYQGQ